MRLITLWIGIAFTLLLGGFVLVLQFAEIKNAIAGTIFYSMSDGEWSDEIWSKSSHSGPDCGCSPSCNFNKTAYIIHKITVSTSSCDPFKMSGGGEIYLSGSGTGKLTFDTDFEMSGGSYIEISAGDSLKINGTVELSASDIWVEGFFIANGDVDLTGNSSICGPGIIQTTGTVTGTTWCGMTVLPVELDYFSAVQVDNYVELKWKTLSEINNDHFTVERSSDGRDFNEILSVEGYGNNSVGMDYEAADRAPREGINYYRLKQTDYNGSSEYFSVEAVKFVSPHNTEEIVIHSVFPNPFNDQISINFSVAGSSDVLIQLIRNSGQVLYSEQVRASTGIIKWVFKDDQNLPAGIYSVQVISANKISSIKVIKRS